MTTHDSDGTPIDTWVIEPGSRRGLVEYARELWRYRRAAAFFWSRSVKLLYAGTQLGWPWLLIRPLAPLAIGALVYGGVMGIPSLTVPYFLFFLSGSIVWSIFEGSLQFATRGLERNRHLVKKLYLPRAILPPATTGAGLVEPLVLLGVLAGALGYYRVADARWYVGERTSVPLLVLTPVLAWLLAVALGFWTSLWQARARDARYVLAWVVAFWGYLTPVIYPLDIVPLGWRPLMFLNPMTALVEAWRAATIGAGVISVPGLLWSAVSTIVLLAFSLRHFTAAEGSAADRL